MPTVSVGRAVPAPISEVWSVLSDIENARRWNEAWTSIAITSPQRHGLGTTFTARTGSGESFDFLISEWSAPELIAFSPIREEGEKYGVTLESHIFRLKEMPETQTLVELTAHASTHGLRGRMTGLIFWPGYQKHGLETALEALGALFEVRAGDETAAESDRAPTGD